MVNDFISKQIKAYITFLKEGYLYEKVKIIL